MFFLSLLSLSHAIPLTGDVQVAIGESGLVFGAEYVKQFPIEFNEEEIAAPYGCWDLVGVRNFNVETQIKDLDFLLTEESITLMAKFEPVYGYNMTIFAEDDQLFDTCLGGYNGELSYVEIQNLYFEIELSPSINDLGLLEMEVVGEPIITGDLDIDLSWFPDGVILYFFEDTIFNQMSTTLQNQIPLLVDQYANILAYQYTINDIEFDVALSETEINTNGLFLGGDANVHYVGDQDCTNEPIEIDETSPDLYFEKLTEADAGFALTENALNRAINNLWAEGFFCFSETDFEVLFSSLESLFDSSAGNLSANASINTIPSFNIENDQINLAIQDVSLAVYAMEDSDQFIEMDFDISAKIDLKLNPTTSSFGISLHDLELEFSNLKVEGLIYDDAQSQENVKRFIEVWVVKEIEKQIQNLSLFQSMFHLFDLYIFVHEINYEDSGFEVYLKLYKEGDPAIDNIAPSTTAIVKEVSTGVAQATWSATDDREGELVFSYRLDNGSWSAWTTDKETTFENLSAGTHILQVKSRDSWWNEDLSPEVIPFEITAQETTGETDNADDACCGCASISPQGVGWFGLIGLLALGRRRQNQ